MIERNLILHQKLHSGQRDYVCDICGKSYFTKSGLQAHQKQNHSPPNESNCGDEAYVKGSGFVCKDKKCEKRHFATRYDLEQHR
jgi:KRAB domain-containing zinc finger protein